MFASTFSVSARKIDLSDPREIVGFISKMVREEMVGRKPFPFLIYGDADLEQKRMIFYDMSNTEAVMEFSSLFGRLPGVSILCDGQKIKIHAFYEDRACAVVIELAADSSGVTSSASEHPEESSKETESLRSVASTTSGLLEIAQELTGKVNASVVENQITKEKLAFFTVKLDARSERNRGIIRSCERCLFAWSDETSYMVMICRFRMLPPFAVSFPFLGKNIQEAMQLHTESQKGVGVVMYADDVNDAFTLERGVPRFE
jgi:hypothetical protein